MKVGIEAMSFYVPQIYLPIKDLAENRGIEPAKLEQGLGLKKMAVVDSLEDTATLAANALLNLFKDYDLNPIDIDRIYLGTESALDSAKPTATYALQMVARQLSDKFENKNFRHIDVVDLTFACIGGIDALQNCLDYIRVNPDRKAIVIAADYAKYTLNSSGEYTQGAGAVAMLLSATPKILSIDHLFGISTESVFDFFKPRRLNENNAVLEALETEANVVEIFSDEPVFDGQYSNECYKDRLREAYFQLKDKLKINHPLYERWGKMAFHLPYAFQGKRMFADIFALENNLDHSVDGLKGVAKSNEYISLVEKTMASAQKASSEIGNLYTASVFMAVLSILYTAIENGENLKNEKIGFLTYGSGSKSKVFEATVSAEWQEALKGDSLFDVLSKRKAIDFETYENLHLKKLKKLVNTNHVGFVLDKIESENPMLLGARYYSLKK